MLDSIWLEVAHACPLSVGTKDYALSILSDIQYAKVEDLMLDPLNPRLGRANTGSEIPQSKIRTLMKGWTLDELAISFIESGFWPQEALIIVREQLYGEERLVVVEGNRRLAALKNLEDAVAGRLTDRKWRDLIEGENIPSALFERVPYIEAQSRDDVDAFLGFRHVTGIKEWKPAEKAQYIAKLIDERHMSYRDVMRKIGSKVPTVRQNYISYKLLLQMENQENISVSHVEDKFSVLFLSLRTEGVRTYLAVDIQAEPEDAKRPVPPEHLKNLENFARWLFGTETKAPVVKDSRHVDDFGRILESPKAVEYLERTELPRFDIAFQMAGGDEPEVIRLIETAADNIEAALGKAHRYTKSKKMRAAAERLAGDAFALAKFFPGMADAVFGDEE